VKVVFNSISKNEEESAVINAAELTDSIKTAISLLENGEAAIVGYKDGEKCSLSVSRIYYIESVDDKSFVYTKNDCYEVRYKLYELEDTLDRRFLRVSKSMICNIRKIRSVKAAENARMKATLLNDETIMISRNYVKDLKKRLGL